MMEHSLRTVHVPIPSRSAYRRLLSPYEYSSLLPAESHFLLLMLTTGRLKRT